MWTPLVAALLLTALAGTASAQFGLVSGTVKDDRNMPVKGATIIAENPDASPASFTASSDRKGHFAMIGLRSGTWWLRVGAPGHSTEIGEVLVRTLPNRTPPLKFILQKLVVPASALGSLAAKDLQASLASADSLYVDQRWDEAIVAYNEILERAPALSTINLQVAAAYRNKGALDEAIKAYNALLKVDPTNDRAIIGIAMVSFEKGDLEMAERTLEIAAQTPDATREVFYDLGDIKFARSQTEQAVKAYEQAARLDPTWGKPPLALGRLAMTNGDADAARRYLQIVTDIAPISREAAEATALLRELVQHK